MGRNLCRKDVFKKETGNVFIFKQTTVAWKKIKFINFMVRKLSVHGHKGHGGGI